MKTILCYGDSNTWGYSPRFKRRCTRNERWAGVLEHQLGEGYTVIEEGLSGRTTVWDDPIEGEYKNGKTYLLPCIESHHPLDAVVIMLGTNDLKKRFGLEAYDIAKGAGTLAQIIQRSGFGQNGQSPKILLIAPPPLARLEGTELAEMFAGGEEKSWQLARAYRRVAEEVGCEFLDAGSVMASSPIDAIHFDPEEHRKLGTAAAEKVRGMLS